MTEFQPVIDPDTGKIVNIPNPDNSREETEKRIGDHEKGEKEGERQDKEREQQRNDKEYTPVDAA